jgi:uncharacterized membrane protein YjgN (DUF898 family)
MESILMFGAVLMLIGVVVLIGLVVFAFICKPADGDSDWDDELTTEDLQDMEDYRQAHKDGQ